MKPLAFVHVPKTAGTAISHAYGRSDIYLPGHVTYEEARKMYGETPVYFSVVRHPVERFKSVVALMYASKDPELCPIPELQRARPGLTLSGFTGMLLCLMTNYKYRDLLLIRSQTAQLQNIPFTIKYEYLDAGIIFMSYISEQAVVPILKEENITKHDKPALSEREHTFIKNYYHEDMARYGYE